MKRPRADNQLVDQLTFNKQRHELLRWANWFIYASIVLGVLLLAQLYALKVPSFLIVSILAGWILYFIVGIAVWNGSTKAYTAALILAVVTLAVSLPQPEHLSLTEAGPTLASLTFIIGSILQAGVIITVGYYMIKRRKPTIENP